MSYYEEGKGGLSEIRWEILTPAVDGFGSWLITHAAH